MIPAQYRPGAFASVFYKQHIYIYIYSCVKIRTVAMCSVISVRTQLPLQNICMHIADTMMRRLCMFSVLIVYDFIINTVTVCQVRICRR